MLTAGHERGLHGEADRLGIGHLVQSGEVSDDQDVGAELARGRDGPRSSALGAELAS
ncbi:hypothetical protein MXD61_10480 [Frankia sp. AgPm24]|uniref:hypothetical protein n=1 Tax=Frankia sp. AgPm24 TaxID=631128 RepID=UPI00200C86D8|nr:hypothetical protein [Frankia sp. AgPm24]MCK9922296.1 hypothetical protein [Frankia sp. AgPm24]